jgi:hypothetical protein
MVADKINRYTDLTFTLDETRQIVQTTTSLYTEADVETLYHYTQGWITGIKLALMRKNDVFEQGMNFFQDVSTRILIGASSTRWRRNISIKMSIPGIAPATNIP